MYSLEFNLNVHHHKYSVNWEHSRFLSLPSPDLSLLSYKTSYLVIFVCRKVSSSLKTQHKLAPLAAAQSHSPLPKSPAYSTSTTPPLHISSPTAHCSPELSPSGSVFDF